MKAWPLRRQITLWTALFTGGALLAFGSLVAFRLYGDQVEILEGQLAAHARLIFASWDEHRETKPTDSGALAVVLKSDRTVYGYLVGPTNAPRPERAHPESLAQLVPNWPPTKREFTRAWEQTRLRFAVFKHGGTTLVLVTSLDRAREEVLELTGAYLVAFPLVMLIVAGGSWWLARRALLPIIRITQAAASITADRLGERLPAPQTEDEIGQHVRVLNGMFDRLQRSFEQATRFTADASHELRTPLTIMRGQIEDALRSGPNTAEQERLLVDLLEETSAMQKTAENLLLLTRFDAGRNPLQRAPFDWSALVAEAGEDAELLAAPRRLKIATEIASGIRVVGDATMLRRVLLNLIDNAVKYNRADGQVRLTLGLANGVATVTVVNTGPGIPPERRPALFERFYRLDSDRNRDTGGSGLGLSLCREIVTAHDGTIALGQTSADWTEFVVRLPVLPADA